VVYIIAISRRFEYQLKISLNDAVDEFTVPIYCPNRSKGCKSEDIKKNGHDYSVKGNPQWFYCKACEKQFYAHTSSWFIEFQDQLKATFTKLFDRGHYNVREIKAELKCSNSTASRLLIQIVEAVNNSAFTELCWTWPAVAKVLFVDETFLKINKAKYWLVVVVTEERRVLAFELVENRAKDTLQRIIDRARARLPAPIELLVTDGLSQYIGIAQEFGHDLVHVRHIHKPPFGRVVITTIRHTPTKIISTHAATYTNILDSTNMFYSRVTTTEKTLPLKDRADGLQKESHPESLKETKRKKGRRGRPKGSKNRPKAVIEAEKKLKEKRKGKVGRPRKEAKTSEAAAGAKTQPEPKKKETRGRKDYFKTGEYMVYQFNEKKGTVIPLWNADPSIAQALEVCTKYFGGGSITTNYIEQQFSTLKKLIDFRGKRTLSTWESILSAYFTVREYPFILKYAIHQISPCPQVQNRWIRERFCPSYFQNTILSENLKEVRG
jgi:transposase-like protein